MLILTIKLGQRQKIKKPEYLNPVKPLLEKTVEIKFDRPDDVPMALNKVIDIFHEFKNLMISVLRVCKF